jgi:hypothetical protein
MNSATLAALKISFVAIPTMFVVTTLFILSCQALLRFFPEEEVQAPAKERAV